MAKEKKILTEKQELRKFGLVTCVPFLLLAGFLYWKTRPSWPIFAGIGAFLSLSALIYPLILRPVEKYWMKFAMVLSRISTFIILCVTFFIMITPFGLVRRLFVKDPMGLKFDSKQKSYWIETESKPGKETYPRPY